MMTLISALQIVVRLYDVAGVSPVDLHQATRTSDAIFAKAGIEAMWRECGAGCDTAPAAAEVLVRIARGGSRSGPEPLGYSLVDGAARGGVLATLYADRIRELAARVGIDDGVLLGRAMAHEIGHMLLGTSAHARSGLMRAQWSARELEDDRAIDWLFSNGEASTMRRTILARSHDAEQARCLPCAVCGAPALSCARDPQ
jgi:hypothetical protein